MILVTGPTGTIGSPTVQALRSRGAKFKVATRSPEKSKAAASEVVRFDWEDYSSYLPALQGIEKIFLLTPVNERQLGYVLQMVAAAKRANIRHIVKLSAIGADHEPGLPILRIHRAAEREIEDSGIPWTFLRPTFFMQNLTNFYRVSPKEDRTLYLPQGTGKTAWIDAHDVGEVAAAVLTSPGHEKKAYTLTGRESLSTSETLAVLSRVFGRQFNYVDVPEEAAQQHLEGTRTPLWLVDGFLQLSSFVKNGLAEPTTDAVKKMLGREPRTIEEWAKEHVRSEVTSPARG